MSQQATEKTYKLTPKRREYYKNRARKRRLKENPCNCGEESYAKIRTTQTYVCLKHLPIIQPLLKLPRLPAQITAMQKSAVFKDLGDALQEIYTAANKTDGEA